MSDAKPDLQTLQEPKLASSISALLTEFEQLAPADAQTAATFAARWSSDVHPVHDRTERSRTFRTVYIVLGVLLAIGLNVGAIALAPGIVADALGAQVSEVMAQVSGVQRWFVFGAAIALLELTFWFITLDADVMRQKRERLAARLSVIVDMGHGPTDTLKSFITKLRQTESFYWKIGVGLTWTNVIFQVISYGCFIYGVIQIGRIVQSAGG